ncbi:hypothetical protein IWC96_05270 [Brevundimonas sp. BAL450]|uniref:hypothetical protein n=1 Tax=Brevundimonas sp. BAL450 TaxID=1708162 RepID=UPI0018CA507D|nr:hypothetical protein [Brevundimonas sp. BAL450]MBG7614692.1 hypothetical protein [Brevundimonas sp. BAL450]
MNEQGCLRLESLIREHAVRLGAPDLGDRSVESDERSEEGVRRRLPPRDRLLRRLDALERHVLLLHRGVYDQAMSKIRGMLELGARDSEGPALNVPSTAIAVLPSATAEGTIEFDLARLPDLSEPLRRIQVLRALIQEDDDAFPG